VEVLAQQFTSPLIYALLASACVAYALGEVTDGSVVLGVVVLNAAIGFAQEFRAGRAIEALGRLVSEAAVVQRDGRWVSRPAAEIVLGDVLTVEAGDLVPADLRILGAHGLRADESALTGESLPVDKAVAPVDPEATLADRSSLLHAGTLAVAGTARALVVRTGDTTELGRISALIDAVHETETPLTRDLRRLGSTITRAVAVVAVALLSVALVRGYPVADAALAAITLAVAAIPEGLPAIVTIALAVGVQRMARRRAVIHRSKGPRAGYEGGEGHRCEHDQRRRVGRSSALVPVDDVRNGVGGVGGQEAGQRDHDAVPPAQRDAGGDAETDLERAHVAQIVLVVRVDLGDRVGEAGGCREGPDAGNELADRPDQQCHIDQPVSHRRLHGLPSPRS
jgi:hypothetical protein